MVAVNVEIRKYTLAMTDTKFHLWDGVNAITDGYLLCHGGGYHVKVFFLTENSPIPPARFVPTLKYAVIYRPSSKRQEYIDLLRNETPVFANISIENPQNTVFFARGEPVGEGGA